MKTIKLATVVRSPRPRPTSCLELSTSCSFSSKLHERLSLCNTLDNFGEIEEGEGNGVGVFYWVTVASFSILSGSRKAMGGVISLH